MDEIKYCNGFDSFESDLRSRVFEYFPKTFKDKRGFFSEILREGSTEDWIKDLTWIKQINRSASVKNTFRGFHAQRGEFCQAKLVENLSKYIIYDIICDARPDSKSFGVSQVFCLNPIDFEHNMLFVPRGFLHSFFVPSTYVDENKDLKPIEESVVFQYFCDNVYDKKSETGVSPKKLLDAIVTELENNEAMKDDLRYKPMFDSYHNELVLSEKDLAAEDYEQWMKRELDEYNRTKKVWYK